MDNHRVVGRWTGRSKTGLGSALLSTGRLTTDASVGALWSMLTPPVGRRDLRLYQYSSFEYEIPMLRNRVHNPQLRVCLLGVDLRCFSGPWRGCFPLLERGVHPENRTPSDKRAKDVIGRSKIIESNK